ncbi:MAG TPA: acyltransferase [Methylomusa anaerophila]|uniref:Acyltransferase family protein n=1 Tax=Methylomusa anaerophila TaxID=1930071 RepID=A0A348AGB4_9FIRM|nr:acyltransferase [Methylomusa anaerophila]BBB90112.1 acyltransferase family protein [Methylomusa anaerophila]HML88164.1 acyltransferase [Methylomusa anaerophila]
MDTYLSRKLKVLSFISIIMVVYLHSYNLNTNLPAESLRIIGLNPNTFIQTFITQGITRIAVPLFFLISGYLFFYNFQQPTWQAFLVKMRKRIHTLVIPYLFWSGLSFLIFYILQNLPFSRPYFTLPSNIINNYTLFDLINRILFDPFAYQLWFIRDLMVYVLFTPVIYRLIYHLKIYSVMALFVCWVLNVNFLWISNQGIFFFMLGSYLAIHKFNLRRELSLNITSAIFVTWLIVIFCKTYIELAFPGPFIPYFSKAAILLGLTAIWHIYDWTLSGSEILLRYSNYTFFIYAMHEPALVITRKLTLKFLGVSHGTLLTAYLLAPIFVICLVMIIGRSFKRLSPTGYSIIVGGR